MGRRRKRRRSNVVEVLEVLGVDMRTSHVRVINKLVV